MFGFELSRSIREEQLGIVDENRQFRLRGKHVVKHMFRGKTSKLSRQNESEELCDLEQFIPLQPSLSFLTPCLS
jgi:hypothetical protein